MITIMNELEAVGNKFNGKQLRNEEDVFLP